MSHKWDSLELRSIINPNLIVLSIFGYWIPETFSPLKVTIYKVYGLLCSFLVFWLLMISEIYNIFMSIEDIGKVVEASFLFLTHCAQCFKIYILVNRTGRIRNLLNSLHGLYFRARDEVEYKMLTKSIKEGMLSFYVYFTMVILTCSLWVIFPLMKKLDGRIELPLVTNYPFSLDNDILFIFIFVYQTLCATINGVCDASKDTIVSSLMTVVCGELDVLNHALANVREFAIKNLEQRKYIDNIMENELVSTELEEEMDNVLTECIHRHCKILVTIREIQDLFHIGVLSQFIASSIIVCVTMYQMTVVELFSVQFMSMFLYQACMLYQLLLYCWYGNEIILRSEKIGYSLYTSDWYGNSNKYKKKMLIIMIRAQIPIKCYAGKLFELSLVTFASILHTSWSYFAVLRRVQDK